MNKGLLWVLAGLFGYRWGLRSLNPKSLTAQGLGLFSIVVRFFFPFLGFRFGGCRVGGERSMQLISPSAEIQLQLQLPRQPNTPR